jgi:4-diphosphocytidyl-2-C-methyl-D-erythritol kinase
MLSERCSDAVTVWAPAKVNLFLEVLAKRPDGYHDIATLMVAVSLFDTLELKEDPSGEIRLVSDSLDLPSGPENLVYRAADLLRRRCGVDRGVSLRLRKRIPLAAGLAGGSSDAAATLAGLNRLWRLGLSPTELAALGAELGSDVAFFFSPLVAWCTGRGEKVEPLRLGRPLFLVLACPPVGVSTAAAYRGVTVPDEPRDGAAMRAAVTAGDPEEIGRCLHNCLQPVAEGLCPEIPAVRQRLEALAPAGVLMSGSGSTVFALCRDHGEALRVVRALAPAPEATRPPEAGAGLKVFLVRSYASPTPGLDAG